MLKGIAIFLSYTGNTKQIAEAIHRGMGPFMGQCDMVRLRETDPKEFGGYDLSGSGSPVRLGNW